MPRIIPAEEWRILEAGLKQRVHALNLFLADVYHGQKISRPARIPAERVLGNTQYRREMAGMDVPGGIYAHIAGVDLVRAGAGEYYVLEDNLRVPSGVSYMLENRRMMMRLFPELFAHRSIRPVKHYPDMLLENLRESAPEGRGNADGRRCSRRAPTTPPTTSTRSWPSRWASSWSRARTSWSQNDTVYMRTTRGPQRVDVIYRRIDDDFLDPLAFRARLDAGRAGPVRRLPRRAG